ncbi:MAG: DUF695 domain-containing protein [Campylobacterota bacterium]|nr:DUF695 domain-containing protein [Campylobacterota bacterium]
MRDFFKRVEDGSEVNIEVVLDAGKYKEDMPWLFSVFVKYDVLDSSSESYEEFLETKESLIIGIEYEDKAKYLGTKIVDGWSEFYFCASSAKELNSMVTAMLKDTGYVYESNIVKDKKWGFYETQLFPTALELAHIQSAKIIFLLQEEEDVLTTPRVVEHYLSFETPTSKNRFINTLDIDGFSFKDDIDSDEFEHGIVLVKEHAVTEDEVQKVVDELFEAVKKEGGFYEGWSTTLVLDEEE